MRRAAGNATHADFPSARMVICFTGNGKGKTTAALGLALRAVGWGKKVLIIQFLKKGEYGEIKAIASFLPNCSIVQFGRKGFVNPKKPLKIDFIEAKKGLARAKREIRYGNWELVILDEINVAIKFGLVKLEEVLDLIKEKPVNLDLVLTGRWACQEIVKRADLVTEFKEIKHPYKKGIKAKPGIDY